MNDQFGAGWWGGLVDAAKDFWVGILSPAAIALTAFWFKRSERVDRLRREAGDREEKRIERERAERDAWVSNLIRERDRAATEAETAERACREATEARHAISLELRDCRAECRAEIASLRRTVNDLERRAGDAVTVWPPLPAP